MAGYTFQVSPALHSMSSSISDIAPSDGIAPLVGCNESQCYCRFVGVCMCPIGCPCKVSFPLPDPMTIALNEIRQICEGSGNVSQYFPYGGEGYKSSVRHYLESSCEISIAAVQPGRVEDLAAIMKVLARTKVPFAVKGGGHTSNPNFSSTTGIQISMARFNKISPYVPGVNSRDVQAGCLFDEVYRAIVPSGQNIVGGSATGGVGIAGWLQGGGYSLKTNQFGLGIDNLVGFQIVLPDGSIQNVTEESNKELFEAVKGGGNNFGILVQFTLKTHEQSPKVYGGLLTYEIEEVDDVKEAIIDFVDRSRDPKAAIVAAFRYFNMPEGEQFKLTVQYFYDGPKPINNPFQKFLDIPHILWTGGGAGAGMEISSFAEGASYAEESSYLEFDQRLSQANRLDFFGHEFTSVDPAAAAASSPSVQLSAQNVHSQTGSNNYGLFPGGNFQSTPRPTRAMAGVGETTRGRWGNVMVSKYTREIVDEVERQAKKAAKYMVKKGGKMVVIDIWPFVREMFDKSSPSAWPHQKGKPNGPLLAYFLWEDKDNDPFWISQMNRALAVIESKVYGTNVKPDTPIYSNTTLVERTLVEEVYRENLKALQETRKKYDPNNVMGQTGGFRIPLPA